ncbi:hypothetical protein [Parapedobacter tibetensis]|uniref:hypothetical protein n=1 Tax=Parapedobacter tibetensis TaxID=2972951 RepID=UPI00214DB39B|nr:hypothetical protein [Parapedobacter tibetensis]
MVDNYVKINLALFLTLLIFFTTTHGQPATNSSVAAKLWEGIGGKENWQNARYFMFSCIGGEKHSFAQGERKYLWDKLSGNCRFDGVTTDDENVIVLFNVKTAEGTAYINGIKIDNQRVAADIIDEVRSDFEKDAYLLFLPTALEGNSVSYTVAEEKLIGSQRFTVVNIKNPKTSFETAIDGQLYMDAQTGQIQEWRPKRAANHFSISGFKDIGGGLVLPTRFTGSDTTTSVTYPLAAALVNIEAQKFNKP